mmetsp:Transcript_9393/g.6752  ORF Transcript_9393/g.6752 Transcript_9393/m.6752 type:complete len:114 (+) Transcript_9393:518-859(+)
MQSSLDSTIKEDCDRYDEQIDTHSLPLRDVNDTKVSDLGHQIIKNISSRLSVDLIDVYFPVKYMQPINNIFNKELKAFETLLKTIQKSVQNLIDNIEGKYPRPLEVEHIWSRI